MTLVVTQRLNLFVGARVIGPHLASRRAADHERLPRRTTAVTEIQQPGIPLVGLVSPPPDVLGRAELLRRVVIFLVGLGRQFVKRVERLDMGKGLVRRAQIGQVGTGPLPAPPRINLAE
ncbi:hypothetical protein [Pseudofrankia asymbiotica]|uniref:hypothetical protein n=1 Tax=Pseudofrankia asymbiotica TaxID=1834516 RepID=UPI00130435FA|nr:hypothetical protein [Pseudofrankia asymbiotica]